MKTVLIVDDEYLIAEILGFALEDAGYEIKTASNGQKALQVLHDTPVQLVITDYMMPVLNGEELARAMHLDPALRTLPVILMSGAQASQGCPALFAAVFDKPFDMGEMIATVRGLLNS